jgi:HCOMODA/2-hydroxy-3-carboxy-muconic semialdehyde decarboxylase
LKHPDPDALPTGKIRPLTLGAFFTAALLWSGAAAAQVDQRPPVPAALVEDLVVANRVLADQGVLDGFGHVSIRHPGNPNRFLMSRSLAPALVKAGDIMEFDLDGNPVDQQGRAVFLERFIHAEVYKARPDVQAVVHSHSPGVIPFGVSQKPMKAMYHIAAFLAAGVPVFEIRDAGGMTDMLVRDAELGKALARSLGDKSVALMRGHGDVVVGPTLPLAVFRAVYTEVNARLQAQAMALGGPINALAPEEGEKANKVLDQIHLRAWDLWKRAVAEKK